MSSEPVSWPPVVVIAGPTAVGKTRLALELARRFDAAIVSADSRQVYRYLDIGTAKPTPAERGNVPHYLLDVVQPSQLYSAQSFSEEGTRVLRLLARHGRPALVVGGTGFYIRALLDRDEFPSVAPNEELRRQLHRTATEQGTDVVYQHLVRLDPQSAARIHPRNLSRIIRAIEIVEATGSPVPAIRRSPAIPALYLGLHRDRTDLARTADLRVDDQIASGLVEETEAVLAMGYGADAPGLHGFGYRQVVEYLRDRTSLPEAVELYKSATRAYIRRQMTWFRADKRFEWLEYGPGAVDIAAARITSWLDQLSG